MAYPDYEEFLASLNAYRVRYLVGGAHAVAFHARPRASKDLDVFVAPTTANARRAVEAVRDFFGGTSPKYVSVENLVKRGVVVQLGVAPVRIDLLSHFATTTFTDAWKRRCAGRFGDTEAFYLALEDLMNEKAHFARPQDLADLAVLTRAAATRSRKRAARKR